MSLMLSILLDDGGAHILAPIAQADELMTLFQANRIACRQFPEGSVCKVQLLNADDIIRANSILQSWREFN